MGAAPAALDELDGARVLHALGALAVDLQDLVSHLRATRGGGEEGENGRRGEEERGNSKEQEEERKEEKEEEFK